MKMFIDFDKSKEEFNINYYLEDYKIVLKIPISNYEESDSNIKIEEFNLTKYTYLIHYK
jgi:hypothetical protein